MAQEVGLQVDFFDEFLIAQVTHKVFDSFMSSHVFDKIVVQRKFLSANGAHKLPRLGILMHLKFMGPKKYYFNLIN